MKTISKHLKKTPLLGPFLKTFTFWFSKTLFTCGQKAESEKKSSFSKISGYVTGQDDNQVKFFNIG